MHPQRTMFRSTGASLLYNGTGVYSIHSTLLCVNTFLPVHGKSTIGGNRLIARLIFLTTLCVALAGNEDELCDG